MIIFTDLDNCLLDSSYSAISIRDFTHNLIERGITISVISSKTSPEIDFFFKEKVTCNFIDLPWGLSL